MPVIREASNGKAVRSAKESFSLCFQHFAAFSRRHLSIGGRAVSNPLLAEKGRATGGEGLPIRAHSFQRWTLSEREWSKRVSDYLTESARPSNCAG